MCCVHECRCVGLGFLGIYKEAAEAARDVGTWCQHHDGAGDGEAEDGQCFDDMLQRLA